MPNPRRRPGVADGRRPGGGKVRSTGCISIATEFWRSLATCGVFVMLLSFLRAARSAPPPAPVPRAPCISHVCPRPAPLPLPQRASLSTTKKRTIQSCARRQEASDPAGRGSDGADSLSDCDGHRDRLCGRLGCLPFLRDRDGNQGPQVRGERSPEASSLGLAAGFLVTDGRRRRAALADCGGGRARTRERCGQQQATCRQLRHIATQPATPLCRPCRAGTALARAGTRKKCCLWLAGMSAGLIMSAGR